MSKPVRIQRKRIKGFRLPENTVSVTRPGKWGNPFKVGEPIWDPRKETMSLVTPQTKEQCLDLYRIYMEGGLKKRDTWMSKHIDELRGKNLACFCPLDQPCHADVLLELANQPTTETVITEKKEG
jgi:hypothetical protein